MEAHYTQQVQKQDQFVSQLKDSYGGYQRDVTMIQQWVQQQ